MNSLDTNILIYAINADCPEYDKSRKLYESMIRSPREWILSDQVLFEFYRALRNPKIFEKPLNHTKALKQIRFLREKSGVAHCAYETGFWPELTSGFTNRNPRSSHIFDRVLAVTLLKNGVKQFFTRNIRDFKEFGFQKLRNPLDEN